MVDPPEGSLMARATTRDGRKAGPKCGATNRHGKACQHPAGWGTNHPGEGRCKNHGGSTQIAHGRYSSINRPRIRDLLERHQADPDPLNLLPELALLRALIGDFIERYDAQTEALIAWHASFGPAFDEQVKKWREELAQWVEECESQGYESASDPPKPPDPALFLSKPRQVVDILTVGQFIGQIGTLADRIHKLRSEGSITLATLDRTLEQLGAEVVNAAQEVIRDTATRSALLTAIERRWGTLRVDTAQPGSARPPTTKGPLN
jgi:hypothetical protein